MSVARYIGFPALLVLMFALPGFANKGIIFLAGIAYLHIVFGLSWNLLFGYSGLVSFGHASYFAIGGYFYAVVAKFHPEVHVLLVLLLAGLFGALVAVLVGIVALRRSQGIYFAILTLALSQIVFLVISYTAMLGREDGFTGIRRPKLPLGFETLDLSSANNYYYFLLVVCCALVAFLWWIVHSRFGRVFRAIQQDAERASFLGVNVQAYRLLSFALASAVAAIAGALYAPWLQLLTPDVAHWTFSARPVLYTLLGGVHYFWGPAVGAVAFSFLEYGTRTLHGLSELVIGGILIVIVLAIPGGLLGIVAEGRAWLARRRSAR